MSMDQIPHEVEAYVRAEASARSAYPGDLGTVQRRARRRRRRTAVVAAAGVFVVAAGVGAAVAVSRPSPRAVPPAVAPSVAPSISVAPPVPAATGRPQRLLLQNAYGFYSTATSGAPVRLAGDDQVGEVRPDLSLVRHRVRGADSWDRAIGLDDGRIVALGPRDLQPGTKRTDGPNVAGLEFDLVVVGTDGKVDLRRDVRRMGEGVTLVGADEKTAYLFRQSGLVAHRLADGTEETVLPRSALWVDELPGPQIEATDLSSGKLATTNPRSPCAVRIIDVVSGRVVDASLEALSCKWITALRFSPSRDRLAVAYQTGVGAGYRFAVVDTARGDLVAENDGWPSSGKDKDQGATAELTWLNDRDIRALIVPTGPGDNRLVDITFPAS
jgi:hypothetical protein